MHDSEYIIDCYTAIPSVAKTIKKLHIQSDLNSSYMHNLYHDEKESIYDLFCQYIKSLLKYIDHPAFIKEQKKYE